MSILITGANGQLGTELCYLLDERNIPYTATDSSSMDITDKDMVKRKIQEINPSFIFHCAAYTAVDKAEGEGKEVNEQVNVWGTKNIAEAAESIEATLVYISTDYVFDGMKNEEYRTDDQPNPQNEYGRAKLEGEKLIEEISSKFYIVRTSWVFGEYGQNFVYTMKRLAQNHSVLTVVDDQMGRPTWTRTLAEFLFYLFEKEPEYGIYHLSNDNSCSWYEFACEILKEVDVEVKPVTSAEFPQKAKRPPHSILDLSKAKEIQFTIPTWQEALETFKRKID